MISLSLSSFFLYLNSDTLSLLVYSFTQPGLHSHTHTHTFTCYLISYTKCRNNASLLSSCPAKTVFLCLECFLFSDYIFLSPEFWQVIYWLAIRPDLFCSISQRHLFSVSSPEAYYSCTFNQFIFFHLSYFILIPQSINNPFIKLMHILHIYTYISLASLYTALLTTQSW